MKMFKNEIHDLVDAATDAEQGTTAWLKVYMSTLSHFMKNMTPEQTEEVEAKVDDWNKEGPDEEYKLE
jgi:hypothetical protein